jgi:hypothetical protein
MIEISNALIEQIIRKIGKSFKNLHGRNSWKQNWTYLLRHFRNCIIQSVHILLNLRYQFTIQCCQLPQAARRDPKWSNEQTAMWPLLNRIGFPRQFTVSLEKNHFHLV